jgi:hypothetical protein
MNSRLQLYLCLDYLLLGVQLFDEMSHPVDHGWFQWSLPVWVQYVNFRMNTDMVDMAPLIKWLL